MMGTHSSTLGPWNAHFFYRRNDNGIMFIEKIKTIKVGPQSLSRLEYNASKEQIRPFFVCKNWFSYCIFRRSGE